MSCFVKVESIQREMYCSLWMTYLMGTTWSYFTSGVLRSTCLELAQRHEAAIILV